MKDLFKRLCTWIKSLFGGDLDNDTESTTGNLITVKELTSQLLSTATGTAMEHLGSARELPSLYYVDISEHDYDAYYALRKGRIERELVDCITGFASETESRVEMPRVILRVGSGIKAGDAHITASFDTRGIDETPRDLLGGRDRAEFLDVTPQLGYPYDSSDINSTRTAEDGYMQYDGWQLSSYIAEVGFNDGSKYPVRGTRTTIGVIRGNSAHKPDIALPNIDELNKCEQIHGEIRRQGEGIWSYRTISANGTTVWRNGKACAVSMNSTIKLQDGDELAFGGTHPIASFVVRPISGIN